jgi:hypothetical protein
MRLAIPQETWPHEAGDWHEWMAQHPTAKTISSAKLRLGIHSSGIYKPFLHT